MRNITVDVPYINTKYGKFKVQSVSIFDYQHLIYISGFVVKDKFEIPACINIITESNTQEVKNLTDLKRVKLNKMIILRREDDV